MQSNRKICVYHKCIKMKPAPIDRLITPTTIVRVFIRTPFSPQITQMSAEELVTSSDDPAGNSESQLFTPLTVRLILAT